MEMKNITLFEIIAYASKQANALTQSSREHCLKKTQGETRKAHDDDISLVSMSAPSYQSRVARRKS